MRTSLVALLLIALNACGGSSEPSSSGTPTGAVPSSTTPAATPTPAEPTERTFTADQLRVFMTNLDDLPAGWSMDRKRAEQPGTSRCGYKAPFKAPVSVARSFTKGGGFSQEVLDVDFAQFKTEKQAAAVVAAVKRAYVGCKTKVDDEQVRYELVSTDAVADETLGINAKAESYSGTLLFARSGRGLLTVSIAGYLTLDFDLAAKHLKRQIQSYAKAAN